MKKVLWAVISALTIISAQGKVGIKEAEAIKDHIGDHIEEFDPEKIRKGELYSSETIYDIIALAALCKHRNYESDSNLYDTNCKDLAAFMFGTLDEKPKLNADVYANIENSIVEITEAQAKLKNKSNKTIISAQAKMGIKEAEAIRDHIQTRVEFCMDSCSRMGKEFNPKEVSEELNNLNLLKKYDLIELAANCRTSSSK